MPTGTKGGYRNISLVVKSRYRGFPLARFAGLPSQAVAEQPVLTLEQLMKEMPCGALLSHRLRGEGGADRHQRGMPPQGGIHSGAAGAHHNPHGRRTCQTFEPFAPSEPSRPPGRQPSHPKGATPSTAHAVPLPHRWGRQVLRKTAHFPIDGEAGFKESGSLPHRWRRQVLRKTAHFSIDGGRQVLRSGPSNLPRQRLTSPWSA